MSVAPDDIYEPSPWDWVRDQVALYEDSGGTDGTTFLDTGLPVVIVTMTGHRTGKTRKVPLMRVTDGTDYAIVASKGGDPRHPSWYHNLVAHPHVRLQDGPVVTDMTVRQVEGDERAGWWDRAVAAYPPYAEYQAATSRTIPVFVATPRL